MNTYHLFIEEKGLLGLISCQCHFVYLMSRSSYVISHYKYEQMMSKLEMS